MMRFMLAISSRPSLSNIGLKSGAINLHAPCNSTSAVEVIRVLSSTGSKLYRIWAAAICPKLACKAIILFGTYSETRSFPIRCRPSIWRLVCSVEPTPIGPSEVCFASRTPRSHFVAFSILLMNFQTSSTGRLMIMLFSILIMVVSPPGISAGFVTTASHEPGRLKSRAVDLPPQTRLAQKQKGLLQLKQEARR